MLGRKKRVQDCDYVFGSSTKFQRRMNGFVKADICRQVSVCLHVFCGISFALKPFCDYSLCSVCILPQPAFYSESAVCILPQSEWPEIHTIASGLFLLSTEGVITTRSNRMKFRLQSAVRSPQSAVCVLHWPDRNSFDANVGVFLKVSTAMSMLARNSAVKFPAHIR